MDKQTQKSLTYMWTNRKKINDTCRQTGNVKIIDICGQTDKKLIDLCGQTGNKIIDICGQTDNKIIDINGTNRQQNY